MISVYLSEKIGHAAGSDSVAAGSLVKLGVRAREFEGIGGPGEEDGTELGVSSVLGFEIQVWWCSQEELSLKAALSVGQGLYRDRPSEIQPRNGAAEIRDTLHRSDLGAE